MIIKKALTLLIFTIFMTNCSTPGFYEHSCCYESLHRLPLIDPYELVCQYELNKNSWVFINSSEAKLDGHYNVDSVCIIDSLLYLKLSGFAHFENRIYGPKVWQIFDTKSKKSQVFKNRKAFNEGSRCQVKFVRVLDAFESFRLNPSYNRAFSLYFMPDCIPRE